MTPSIAPVRNDPSRLGTAAQVEQISRPGLAGVEQGIASITVRTNL